MADRDFPRLLAAEGISTFGTMLSRPAMTQLAMLTLQATPSQLAALLMADVAAVALGSLLLGSLVDRSGKRAASVRPCCCATPCVQCCWLCWPMAPGAAG